MEVNRISFDDLKSYWIEVDHFGVPGKKFRDVVRRLGPYRTVIADPRRQSYGLFDAGRLIGVTHLVEWSDHWLRYRTLNVRPEYRGQDLGWFLLQTAVTLDWQDWKSPENFVFGWVTRAHLAWSLNHGFTEVDGGWQDDHVAVIKPMSTF